MDDDEDMYEEYQRTYSADIFSRDYVNFVSSRARNAIYL